MKEKEFKESKSFKEDKTERRRMKQSTKNGFGWGLLASGFYLLLAYFNVFPFTPRFELLSDRNSLLFISILAIVLGAILNDKIRNFFR